ncbi:MAG: hypothetical protein KBA64_11205 [Armatimonadetes bacterium]|jgi:hypothetical protein|nr:hypothetical protein [Armatimonadota bacterium]MDI9603657.1 hypothetical protein [Acidobacteriota bacterium]NLN89410.1 hypothetical protein [candidate division WS1 bacterium]
MRVTLIFRTGKKPLTGELREETSTTYEIRYVDKDMKFRHASVPKTEVKEVRPLLGGLR